MASTATLGLSNYYGGRSRSRLSSVNSEPQSSSYLPSTVPRAAAASSASSNPIVQYTKEVERMRSERNRLNTDVPGGGFGSNSSLDRAGLASPSSPGPLYSGMKTGTSSGYLRSRPLYGSDTSTPAAASASRGSILESSDVLRPVALKSPYGRADGRSQSKTRTSATDESTYDYSSRSGSLARRRVERESRDSSTDRSTDLRNRNGRRVPNGDSDIDDEVSVASTATTYRTANGSLPPHATSQIRYSSSTHGIPVSNSRSDLAYSGSPKVSSLQRYDSTSSLRSGRFLTGGLPTSASSGTLQRYGSNSSLSGQRFSSRRSSRGDLSVNFDLSKLENGKRERSPSIVLVSRVAVEKELPPSSKSTADVESRYVVGKFSTGEDGVRNVPIQVITDTVRERSISQDRSMSDMARGRDLVKYQPPISNGYGRKQSGERVVGGKQFLSDSSLGDSSSEDEGPARHRNSIIRASSPPSSRRSMMLPRKANISVDESDKAGLIGLKNLGNTCFMNSILQCLSNTRPLRDYCLLGEYEPEVNTTTSQMKGALISAFASVLEALWKRHTSYSATSPYVPDKFHRQVQQYAPRFSGYLQQDAQEFLRYLLEGLHEDVNRVTEKPRAESVEIPQSLTDAQKATESWKRYLRRDNSKIVDLFVGQLKSSLICESCGYCSVTCDPFWDLSLPIPGSRGGRRSDPTVTTDLTECFKLFTKEELLDGEECPTCCNCKTRQQCRKFFRIQRFPKYFVIHLKRFSQERFRAKLSTLVEYPVERLDLSSFAAEHYHGPHPTYNLYAVSCHSGSTHCGHYTAFCKHPVSGKWNEYNDSRVGSARLSDIVTSEAYVLFYELVS